MWRNFLLWRKGGVFSAYSVLGFMEIVSFRYIKYLYGIYLQPVLLLLSWFICLYLLPSLPVASLTYSIYCSPSW